MKKVKITVLKRYLDEEIVKEYGSEGIGKCSILKEGDEWITGHGKPENFCDDAWTGIQHYVFALAHDNEMFYDGRWVKQPGTAICSCNDGLRPVIFKIEKID